MKLVDFINQQSKISPELVEAIETNYKKEELPKGHIVYHPNNKSKKLYFIEKGLARLFYQKDDKEITHFFFPENSFLTPIESVFFGDVSPWGLELLEDSTIRSIDFEKMERLITTDPQLEKFVRFFLINRIRKLAEKLFSIQFQTAKERYDLLIKSYPDILRRAPLGHVASYLGITQQTLSVIRSQK